MPKCWSGIDLNCITAVQKVAGLEELEPNVGAGLVMTESDWNAYNIPTLFFTTNTYPQAGVHLVARLCQLPAGGGSIIRSVPGLQPEPAALGAKIRPARRVYGIMGGRAKMRDRCLCKTVQKSVSEYGVQINTILEF